MIAFIYGKSKKLGKIERYLTGLLLLLVFTNIGFGQKNTLTYERNFKDDLLYLHALLNYDMPPGWYYEWEKNQWANNSVKTSFGSIELNKFLSDFKTNLNVELTDGVWFRNINIWYGSQHRNLEEKTFLLGLDKSLYRPFYVFLMFDPALNKDEIDSYMGFYVADTTQANYLRLGMYFDDFDYSVRNEVGGEQVKDPTGIRWFARYEMDQLTFYSDGKWTTGFERVYEDSLLSPDLTAHNQRENQFNLKFYYHFDTFHFIQAGFWYYEFQEMRSYYEAKKDYDFSNRINQFYLKYVFPWGHENRFRAGLDLIDQESRGSGYSEFDYKRSEVMPSIFYERIFSNQMVEVGAMFSVYDISYDSPSPEFDYLFEDSIEKVMIAWTYRFNQNSQLKLSLSHVFSIQGFGGGNIQYYVYF